jgi:hypothetical protein
MNSRVGSLRRRANRYSNPRHVCARSTWERSRKSKLLVEEQRLEEAAEPSGMQKIMICRGRARIFNFGELPRDGFRDARINTRPRVSRRGRQDGLGDTRKRGLLVNNCEPFCKMNARVLPIFTWPMYLTVFYFTLDGCFSGDMLLGFSVHCKLLATPT